MIILIILFSICQLSSNQNLSSFNQTISSHLYLLNSTSIHFSIFLFNKTYFSSYSYLSASFTLQYPPIIPSYMQISQQILNSNPLTYDIMDQTMYIDILDYSLNKQQFLLIPLQDLDPSIEILYVYVFCNKMKQYYYPLNVKFNLRINLTQQIVCPNSCNNVGRCLKNGKCQCDNQYFGSDCSIKPINIQLKKNVIQLISPIQFTFFKISSNLNCEIILSIKSLYQIKRPLQIYMQYSFSSDQFLTPWEYNQFYNLYSYDSIELQLSLKQQDIWILIINKNSQTAIKIDTSKNIKFIDSSKFFIGFGLFMLFIILSCCIYSCYYKKKQQQSKNQIFSSSVIYQSILPNLKYCDFLQLLRKNQLNFNMNEFCIICLQQFTSNSHIAIIFCNHIYHLNCLKKWFQKQKVQYLFKKICPCCRYVVRQSQLIQQQNSKKSQLFQDKIIQILNRKEKFGDSSLNKTETQLNDMSYE